MGFDPYGERSFFGSEKRCVGSGWQYKQLYRSGFFSKASQNIVLLFLFFGQENHAKSHILVVKMKLAELKMHFATYKTVNKNNGPGPVKAS